MNLESHKALLHIIWDKVENTRNAGQKEYAQDIEMCLEISKESLIY